jgi:RNA polymerase sigma-70 factor (ECF subfamily)
MQHDPGKTRASLLGRLEASPAPAAAWDDFVRVYGAPVHRWCRDHGLQPADAADVAQEVLVRFWRQSARFRYDPRSTFRGYLRAIVRHAVADWHSERRGPHAAGCDSGFDALAQVPARDDLAARLEEAFDTERLSLAMHEVRNRVQPHTWRAFQLQVIEQCPGVDVAAQLGVDVNVVYVARHKVMRMIRETVNRMEDEETDGFDRQAGSGGAPGTGQAVRNRRR